jgi:hypothetical protein
MWELEVLTCGKRRNGRTRETGDHHWMIVGFESRIEGEICVRWSDGKIWRLKKLGMLGFLASVADGEREKRCSSWVGAGCRNCCYAS